MEGKLTRKRQINNSNNTWVNGITRHFSWVRKPNSSSTYEKVLKLNTHKFQVQQNTHSTSCLPLCVSLSVVSDSLQPYRLQPARLLCPWDSLGKNTGVDCHSLLQGIFPTQGSNWRLLHLTCIGRWVLYVCLPRGATWGYSSPNIYTILFLNFFFFLIFTQLSPSQQNLSELCYLKC